MHVKAPQARVSNIVMLPLNVGLDLDLNAWSVVRLSDGMYTRTLLSHVIHLVTRSDDTWTPNNGHSLAQVESKRERERERERSLSSHRIEEEDLWRFKKTKLES